MGNKQHQKRLYGDQIYKLDCCFLGFCLWLYFDLVLHARLNTGDLRGATQTKLCPNSIALKPDLLVSIKTVFA